MVQAEEPYMVRVHVNLPSDELDEIDRLAGQKGRSAFVRKAVRMLLNETLNQKVNSSSDRAR